MYDLSMKDKPRSALGKLKDRVKGKKRGDAETNSAIVPRGYAALSGSGRLAGDAGDDEDGEEGALTRKGKIKGFFGKGKLRKTSDTRSSTSLTSEGSTLSSPGGSLSPTAGISMVVSDLSNSPSNSSNLTADNSPVHTTQPSPLLMTHKRAFSDEASKVTAFLPAPRAVENLKAQSTALSRSTLCINGSHIYGGEPAVPRSVSVLQTRLGLLDKCSPLSRSLQNLTRRSEDPARAVGAARRWSFDRAGKEEKSVVAPAPKQPDGGLEEQVQGQEALAAAVVKPEAASEEKKPKRNLFSQGKSDSAGKGTDLGKGQPTQSAPTTEERHRGWFGTKDPQNKPSPEVSPKVETSSDAPFHLSPHSPNHLSPSPSPALAPSPTALGSPRHANPFTPSPATPPISPSNPFFTRLQYNPFFEELIADQALKTVSPAPCPPNSTLWPSAPPPNWPGTCPSNNNTQALQENIASKRDRPTGVCRQQSLPALLPRSPGSPSLPATRSMSAEWDDSFEAFASSRLRSQKAPTPQTPPKALSPHRANSLPRSRPTCCIKEETSADLEPDGKAPPLPPRRPVKEVRPDSWLDRAEELAVKKEACLLFQTDVASMLHQKEVDYGRIMTFPSQQNSSDTELFTEGGASSCPSGCSPSPLNLLNSNTGTTGHYNSSLETTASKAENRKSSPEDKCISESNLDNLNNFKSEAFEGESEKPLSVSSPGFAEESKKDTNISALELTINTPELQSDTLSQFVTEMATNKSDVVGGIQSHKLLEASFKDLDVITDIACKKTSKIATVYPRTNKMTNSLCPALQGPTTDLEGVPKTKEVNNNYQNIVASSAVPGIIITESYSKPSSSFAEICTEPSALESISLEFMSEIYRNAAETSVVEPDLSVSVKPMKLTNNLVLPPADKFQSACNLTRATEKEPSFGRAPSLTSRAEVNLDNKLQCSVLDFQHNDMNLNDSTLPVMHYNNTFKGNAEGIFGNNLNVTNTLTFDCSETNPPAPANSDFFVVNLNTAKEHGLSEATTNEEFENSSRKDTCNETVPLNATALPPPEEPSSGTIDDSTNEFQISNRPAKDSVIRKEEGIHASKPPGLFSSVPVMVDKDTLQSKELHAKGSYPDEHCLRSQMISAARDVNEPLGRRVHLQLPFEQQRDECASPVTLSLASTVSQDQEITPESRFVRTELKHDHKECTPTEQPLSESTKENSFKDLHAKLAPDCRSLKDDFPSGDLLHVRTHQASSTSSPVAKTNSQPALSPSPILPLMTVRPSEGTAKVAAPFSTVLPLIGAAHTVLPEETQPASSILSRHESSPHPVKPLTATLQQGEKKAEGRSVLVSGLEKLRSTIHPRWTSSQSETEADRSKPDSSAQYLHLTHSELVALLLQKEAELEKQRAELEKQGTLLEKREVELKKMKMQVRDLEDYIDRLLVRIMEQTPALLQVRSRYK
ncbi:uncharacterized protein [Paramormyrops kingsleyae]